MTYNFSNYFVILSIIDLYLIYLSNAVSQKNNCEILDKFCYCDNLCKYYGDCCVGHPDYGLENQVKSSTDYLFQCLEIRPNSRSYVKKVNSCPVGLNENLNNLCRNTRFDKNYPLLNYVPVLTQKNNLIFENAFCAQCNGFTQYEFLNISISLEVLSIKNLTEVNEVLKLGASPYAIEADFNIPQARKCNPDFIRSCPDKLHPLNINCTYDKYSEVINMTHIFRNEFCCECHNMTCFPLLQAPGFSMSFILNFNEWTNSNINKLESINITNSNFTSNVNNTHEINDGNENKVIYYISYVFVVISILALIFLILLYILNKTFHNFGGYLTICLCSCLLVVNILLLLIKNNSISNSIYCKYFGIVLHFFLLSNFVWMSLYALDLLQTFATNRSRGKKKTFKTFLIYFVIGFGAVAILVISASIFDSYMDNNSKWRPGYGGSNCFFTNKIGGIVWYFFPVCLLLLWNLIACIIVFYKLHKTSKECRMAKKGESNCTIWICMRLTAVFGLGYILQILAISSNIQILINVGTLINCLQGLFLAICFFWAKRVRTAVKTSFTSLTRSVGNSSMSQQRGGATTTITAIGDDTKSKTPVSS